MPDKSFNSTEPTQDAERTDDRAFTGPAPELKPDALDPEAFDLAEWLDGLGPITARYPLAGGRYIEVRARTADWNKAFGERMAAEKMEAREMDLRWVAEHITTPVTVGQLRKMREHRPRDYAALVTLTSDLYTKPEAEIGAPFLRGASA